MASFQERVFSGVQPTGNLHLGNYLGAIKRFVALQDTFDCVYCVVDLHAITHPVSVWGGPEELSRQTREVTAAFLAAGIDPKKNIVFNQSQVQEHAELAWVFNCVARMGWLSRMTQFKEKAGRDRENASSASSPTRPSWRPTSWPTGDACAGRRRPEAASRAHARHRPKFNNDFAPWISSRGYGDAFFR
jgi:tryptophanyl-tRNA synthetase